MINQQIKICKTNPILSAVGGLQMNVTKVLTKDYVNKPRPRTLAKQSQNKANFKPNQTQPVVNGSTEPFDKLRAVSNVEPLTVEVLPNHSITKKQKNLNPKSVILNLKP